MNEATWKIAEALRRRGLLVRCNDRGGRARCCCHDDRLPSLVFGDWRGGARLRCWAGCKWQVVAQELGLQPSDLYGEGWKPVPREDQQIIARYAYGAKLEKLRYGPVKGFSWRSCIDGRWGAKLRGKRPGLYRCDDLIDSRLVLILEGEKGVDRAADLGFAATCPPFGAASPWPTEYSETIWRAGAQIVAVVADNDQAGRCFAQRVARACCGFRPALAGSAMTGEEPWASWPELHESDPEAEPLRTKLIELPNLPVGGDLYDFVDQGGTAAQLADLIASTPFWTTDSDYKLARRREQARLRQQQFRQRKREQRERNAEYKGESLFVIPYSCVTRYGKATTP